jgi:hypothetical protein
MNCAQLGISTSLNKGLVGVQAAHFEVLECGIVAVPLIHATSDNTVIGRTTHPCHPERQHGHWQGLGVVPDQSGCCLVQNGHTRDLFTPWPTFLYGAACVNVVVHVRSTSGSGTYYFANESHGTETVSQTVLLRTCTALWERKWTARVTFRRAVIIPLPSSRNTIRRKAKRFGFDPFAARGIGFLREGEPE